MGAIWICIHEFSLTGGNGTVNLIILPILTDVSTTSKYKVTIIKSFA